MVSVFQDYKRRYKQAVDMSNSDFKAPFHQIGHARDVVKPKDTWCALKRLVSELHYSCKPEVCRSSLPFVLSSPVPAAAAKLVASA